MALSFIALGANLAGRFASPAEAVENAISALNSNKIKVMTRSCLYRSTAWPDPADPEFVNAMAAVDTDLPPAALLAHLHAIEADFGRVRRQANAPRSMDLDIVDYGGTVSAPEDTPILPHPRMAQRAFVLLPLADIAPDWRHPGTGTTIAELIRALADPTRGVAAMKRYLRPLGILSGSAARDAIAAGLAQPLTGGLAYTLVEEIIRDVARIERVIKPLSSEAGEGGARRFGRDAEDLKAYAPSPSHFLGPSLSRLAGEGLNVAVMGIVNATPDSFSDGGAYLDPSRAIAHAEAMIQAGAAIVDIGGESTRPGSDARRSR